MTSSNSPPPTTGSTPTGRTIVVGDLHGCFAEATALLALVKPTAADQVIFVGDLVDRGPNPRECVELAMKHRCVLGNHEEKHLQQRRRPAEKLLPDHLTTREALTDVHFEYFASLPKFIDLPEHGAAVVHAGAFPGRPLAEQLDHHLLHIQCILPPSNKSFWPSKAPADHTFWTNHWTGPRRLIFGHSVLTQPLVTEHAVGIDTGVVFGGRLTAVILPEWTLVSVPSQQVNPRSRPGRYPVHGEVMAFS